MREIRHTTDRDLNKVVLVPLDYNDPNIFCTLFEDTYQEMMDHNWPEYWYLNSRDKKPVLWSSTLQQPVYISRLVMKAGPGEEVLHRDKDTCNLRTTNLEIRKSGRGRATRREWDHPPLNLFPDRKFKHVWEYNPHSNNWLKGVNEIRDRVLQTNIYQERLDRLDRTFGAMKVPLTTRNY